MTRHTMSGREVPLQEMSDGAVGDGHKVLSANKRMGMVGVLAVVACTAVFFNAEEQAAEAKIWDREMAGLRNATALPDQQNRRFVIPSKGVVSWGAAEERCKALGVSICPASKVCQEKDKKREQKDRLKTGGKKSRLSRKLCRGAWGPAGLKAKVKAKKAPDARGVCKEAEEQALLSRWLPVLEGSSHAWVSIKTCETKPSMPDEQVEGVIACCGGDKKKHQGMFAAVHPASVIQAAEKMVKQRKESGAKNTDDWSKHEYIDKMRNSDPFLAHKKQGTKMKAVHHHVAEKASEHLGNATVAAVVDGVTSFHNKIKTHVNKVVDALKANSNSTAVGAVSGALKTSDPSASFKMSTLGQAAGSSRGSGGQAMALGGLGKQGSLYGGARSSGQPAGGASTGRGQSAGWSTRQKSAAVGAMPGKGRGGSVETRRPMMMAAGN